MAMAQTDTPPILSAFSAAQMSACDIVVNLGRLYYDNGELTPRIRAKLLSGARRLAAIQLEAIDAAIAVEPPISERQAA